VIVVNEPGVGPLESSEIDDNESSIKIGLAFNHEKEEEKEDRCKRKEKNDEGLKRKEEKITLKNKKTTTILLLLLLLQLLLLYFYYYILLLLDYTPLKEEKKRKRIEGRKCKANGQAYFPKQVLTSPWPDTHLEAGKAGLTSPLLAPD